MNTTPQGREYIRNVAERAYSTYTDACYSATSILALTEDFEALIVEVTALRAQVAKLEAEIVEWKALAGRWKTEVDELRRLKKRRTGEPQRRRA